MFFGFKLISRKNVQIEANFSVLFQNTPYVLESDGEYEGFIKDLLDELDIEGGYEFVMPDDRKYGRKENGKWTGMMGMVTEQV